MFPCIPRPLTALTLPPIGHGHAVRPKVDAPEQALARQHQCLCDPNCCPASRVIQPAGLPPSACLYTPWETPMIYITALTPRPCRDLFARSPKQEPPRPSCKLPIHILDHPDPSVDQRSYHPTPTTTRPSPPYHNHRLQVWYLQICTHPPRAPRLDRSAPLFRRHQGTPTATTRRHPH